MKRFWLFAVILLLVLTACAPAATEGGGRENTPPAPQQTEAPPLAADKLPDYEAESLALKGVALALPLEPYADAEIGAQMGLLPLLELCESNTLETLLQDVGDVTTYVKTEVKYADFKAAMLERVSEERFARFAHYKDMDGYVGITAAAAGYDRVTVQEASFVSRENDRFTFTLRLRDEGLYSHFEFPEEGESITEEECHFAGTAECIYRDGKMLVDKIIYKN